MRIAALAGGVGGARFVRGLVHELREVREDQETEVVVIGNTGDDITLFGLRICPDLDTILYTLGGGINEAQGWGRDQETHTVQRELAELGAQPQWFGLGDADFATHIARSQWLGQGMSLTEVTARLAGRWGLPGQGVRLLPATDTPIETHVVIDDDEGGQRAVHFQQWWVQLQAAVPAHRFTVAGLAQSTPAPGVLDTLRTCDVVLLPPSNPVVSIGIILGVPGIRDALRGSRAPVVGVSPIIGGAPVRGHADACLATLDVEVSAAGVAGLYADFLDGWLVDDADAGSVRVPRLDVRALDLRMRDVPGAARIAGAALDLATDLAARRTA
ncbi:2-phospho-L-lactate transferase [Ornithinimicrobium cryptoxanthini]|uniref:2-phospho-L-lactate transferase n=1 Tax=Ornithinimicrobium cryptoxanthini TaxID=2934161 RepID=A0ABY4YF57_9MICO|nr:2-phospho-L-lactate transferase [Ornithinimicrobium cryptoxanthini]USQ75299.1 2-phospho-L-lactate transferase [Ornithinimicrobium cryptoxanthini]